MILGMEPKRQVNWATRVLQNKYRIKAVKNYLCHTGQPELGVGDLF